MKLLGIESSCEVVSVALSLDGNIEQRPVHGGKNASETLIPTIMRLLADMDVSLAALDGIVLGAGPGAFTGLRLGCSVAQGFSLSANLPILPVCSLEAIALDQARPRVLVVTDARMGETYHAAYICDGESVATSVAPACVPPESVALPDSGTWWVAGSALGAYPDRLSLESARVDGVDANALPQASALVRLAMARGLSQAVDAVHAAPLYVRDKVALTTAERLARGGKA
ncbi:tRNA (adenosine(37)-N6)-threonylcarbamoyltransferase complex dimerization subunit type 1 TsaB [Nitrogeniibacter aestuarii]|uniref:tRNA (adenosine(37)-N6)-threonylcarbamoyltransferase complex dimerization subunit type 1 TsaB n=1 Tax=Nitrogeniibacter aestuarii TaxID=2815343 RepID=UPI001D118538|nr:tRNA (adenosine(37)-N6)-threonylcarbamoyltransferase complex dimerization subunit type 1 TsaB [Nitrogeniibacter aestuarii]